MVRLGLAALGALLISGCGPQIRTTLIGQPQPEDPDRREILVFSTAVPRCPFEEIALVSVRRNLRLSEDMDGLLATFREHARKLGGHAIVGLAERPGTEEESPSLSGTVVRFRDPGCRESGGD